MIDKISSAQPNAKIYIMSILPVTKDKSDTSVFTMNKVNTFNSALRTLASQKRCKYLDICSSYVGSDGYLPSYQSTDGIHLQASAYRIWENYLRTHY